MRKLVFAALVAGALMLAGFAGAAAGAATASPASTQSFSYRAVYLGALTHGSRWKLVADGMTVGSARANCNPAHLCTVAFMLPHGRLQGSIRLNLTRTTDRGSITKGSGRYRNDTGWFELIAGENDVTFAFHLK